MKKLGLLVMPLMAISLLASCGSKTTWAVKMKVTASDNEVISFDCGIKDTFTVNWGDGTTNSEKSHTYAAGTYDIKINNQLQTFIYTSENRDSILELEINDLLTIGLDAFEECSKLSVVSFTANTPLHTIGKDAFGQCISLTSVVIPSNVTQISESAFSLSGLQTVDFEKGSKLEIIDRKVFSDCKDLSTIKIPSSIKRIYQYAFNLCDSLIYNTKDKINYLGNDENPYLVAIETTDDKQSTTYTIDENCRIIYFQIFYRSQTLSSITIPSNVISIAEGAFEKCPNLTAVNFSDDSILETIDDSAFQNCSALNAITLPNSVTYIGSHTFGNCSSLANVYIPNNINYVGEFAFLYCDSISSYYQKENIKYLGNDNVHYVVAMGTTDNQQSSIYTLDENCRIIYDSAFEYCSGLTSTTIPEKVTSIGRWAFGNCESLESIIIPDTVTNIFNYAFQYCDNLTSVALSNNLNVIPEGLFSNCSKITSIFVPNSVTKIENICFMGCSQLSVVDLTALKTVPEVNERNRIFEECSDSLKLYVTHEMIDDFKAATGWNKYADKITDEPVPSL